MSPLAQRLRKGEETRAQILEAAVQQASEGGFESITIGTLAARTGLSKSGLFAHFGSRGDLQMAVLDETARRFTEAVFLPALKAPRGLRRLRALFGNWLTWTDRAGLHGSCPIQSAGAEYDDKPGPMRDAAAEKQRAVAREIIRAVKMSMETGELRSDSDPQQFAFEMYGLALACYQMRGLLGDSSATARALAGFERLVEAHRAPAGKSVSRPAAARR